MKEGRNEGRKKGRKEGQKEWKQVGVLAMCVWEYPSSFAYSVFDQVLGPLDHS